MLPHWARNVWRDMVLLGERVGVALFGVAGEHGFSRRLRAMTWFGSQKA